MQCYKTYAASILIANTLEILPEFGRKLPLAKIADWMERHNIEPEDVLYAGPDAVKARLVSLIKDEQPQNSLAA